MSRCSICDSTDQIRAYGGRHFCDDHYKMFYEDLPTLWQVSIVTFGFLIGLVVALVAISLILTDEAGATIHGVVSIATATLPTLIWFVLLYRVASRSHRELPTLLPVLAGIAVLMAAAAVHPFQTSLLDLESWLARMPSTTRLLGTILLKGVPNTFMPYFAVLLITWRTGQFERRADGVLFAMATALPYAATLSILYVLDHGTLTFLSGNLRVIALQTSIITSSIVLGYFFGQNRFQDMPPYYLSLGIALAAGLNGLLLFSTTELDSSSLSITSTGFSPWPGIVVSLLVLAGVFGMISGLMRRQSSILRARLETKA